MKDKLPPQYELRAPIENILAQQAIVAECNCHFCAGEFVRRGKSIGRVESFQPILKVKKDVPSYKVHSGLALNELEIDFIAQIRLVTKRQGKAFMSSQPMNVHAADWCKWQSIGPDDSEFKQIMAQIGEEPQKNRPFVKVDPILDFPDWQGDN